MSAPELKHVVEAALFAAGRPLTLDDMIGLFATGDLRPDRAALREVLGELAEDWAERGVELVEVASGHRFQVRKELGAWMAPLWAERPPRYSRALLETLALVAYRQPITRAEIEEVRGVSVSSSIVKTLIERDWIRVLGHREVPGRPALYGTTREFLDALGLKKLDDLPPLGELTDLDQMHDDLFSGLAGAEEGADEGAGERAQESAEAGESGAQDSPGPPDAAAPVDGGHGGAPGADREESRRGEEPARDEAAQPVAAVATAGDPAAPETASEDPIAGAGARAGAPARGDGSGGQGGPP